MPAHILDLPDELLHQILNPPVLIRGRFGHFGPWVLTCRRFYRVVSPMLYGQCFAFIDLKANENAYTVYLRLGGGQRRELSDHCKTLGVNGKDPEHVKVLVVECEGYQAGRNKGSKAQLNNLVSLLPKFNNLRYLSCERNLEILIPLAHFVSGIDTVLRNCLGLDELELDVNWGEDDLKEWDDVILFEPKEPGPYARLKKLYLCITGRSVFEHGDSVRLLPLDVFKECMRDSIQTVTDSVFDFRFYKEEYSRPYYLAKSRFRKNQGGRAWDFKSLEKIEIRPSQVIAFAFDEYFKTDAEKVKNLSIRDIPEEGEDGDMESVPQRAKRIHSVMDTVLGFTNIRKIYVLDTIDLTWVEAVIAWKPQLPALQEVEFLFYEIIFGLKTSDEPLEKLVDAGLGSLIKGIQLQEGHPKHFRVFLQDAF